MFGDGKGEMLWGAYGACFRKEERGEEEVKFRSEVGGERGI